VTDAGCEPCGQDRLVLITIRLDVLDPPAGWVSLRGGREVAFEGWLGLLRVLSELLGSPPG
jgi:hypothetical protein